ncbi:hypothetical protein CRG98_023048 [Punica granatum]|uniref:Retrotransposon Copia-like N-terminal domain-containing protein n=1 Tax=Punica granatum TaxID=22663 RepID=A0A2I0JJU0_PUNGR|nr:hypothetical protein CRG98_023048 [Punica granatum]
METRLETAFKMMNQDFVKLGLFNGANYSRWKDNMMFFSHALKISYMLDPSLSEVPAPQDNDTEQVKVERKEREEDEVLCWGHILNTLLDRLYDLYTSVTSLKEIWQGLENKYKAEEQGADKFLITKFLECKMEDHLSMMG